MRPERTVGAHHFQAMGTTCSVFVAGALPATLLTAEFQVRELAARLTRFDEASELSRLNASAGCWFDTSPELDALLRESLRAYEISAGLVNVAVLPAMEAAGYTRPLADGLPSSRSRGGEPAPRLPEVLEVAIGRARLAPGARLDLGGIAKGWMADRLCARLGANALVNLGGDLRACGRGPSGEGWPVGLAGQTVMLDDHGAATSSVLRRRWGGGIHHIIDPRTGVPANNGLSEVSVVTRTAVEAEVVAKAALIGGPDLAPAFCAAHAEAWWLRP